MVRCVERTLRFYTDSDQRGGCRLRNWALRLIRLPSVFYLLAAAVLVVTLFWGGRQPFAVGLFPGPFDKVAHSAYFATLGLLLWFGSGGRWPVLLFLAASAVGGLDELHQATLPGRQAGLDDFLADAVAAGLVISVLAWYRPELERLRAA